MIPHFPYLGFPYNWKYSRYGYHYPYYTYKNYSHSSKGTTIKPNNSTTYNNTNSYSNYNNNNSSKISKNYNRYNNNNNIRNNPNFGAKSNSFNDKAKMNDNCKEGSNNTSNDNTSETRSDSPIFQLFGINLYFDDLLIIGLIWFLYNEGVKDEELFIALILLLLS